MHENYGRDLDLNLLRVFALVAETGSVTAAASKLYLTQPAVSAALRRLTDTIGAPLFVRDGRGIQPTARGRQLLDAVRPALRTLVEAALVAPVFDPKTSDRTLRLGLADAAEVWILPALLRVLEREAPNMRVVAIPVQFRTIAAALADGLDAAISVADELPTTMRRESLFAGGFVCLYDPRRSRIRKLTEADYFAREHVVVSYNGDLRGIIEDLFRKQRRIRCSVSSFANLGAIVDGSPLLATVPAIVAKQIVGVRPHLATKKLPFSLAGTATELIWPVASDDDEPCKFARARIREIAKASGYATERRDPARPE